MDWLIPSLAFAAVSGLIGVTTKLALQDLPPLELFLWAALAYVVVGAITIASGTSINFSMAGVPWAIATGVLAATGILIRFLALRSGEVSKVMPVTAGYPVVSVVIAVLLLGEMLTAERAIGTVMVVGGIVILGQP